MAVRRICGFLGHVFSSVIETQKKHYAVIAHKTLQSTDAQCLYCYYRNVQLWSTGHRHMHELWPESSTVRTAAGLDKIRTVSGGVRRVP